MADARSLTPISEADYEAIEAAVMETARGRWFLREYARRNRNADTRMLLDAIGRLENAVSRERRALDVEQLRRKVQAMADATRSAQSEINSLEGEIPAESLAKTLRSLRDLENRVTAMMASLEGHEESTRDEGLGGPSASPSPVIKVEAFAEINRLSTQDKLRLFT